MTEVKFIYNTKPMAHCTNLVKEKKITFCGSFSVGTEPISVYVDLSKFHIFQVFLKS